MDGSDITIEILRAIQAGIAETNARLGRHGETLEAHGNSLAALSMRVERLADGTAEGLAKLHADLALTNETLGVIRERLDAV